MSRALAKAARKPHEPTRRAGRRLGGAVGRDAGATRPCLSRSRHQARRSVLAGRRHRCCRPAVGGEDEAVPRHRGDGKPGRRRRRDRRHRGGARAAGRPYFPVGNTSTQVLIPAIMHNPPYDPLKDFVGIYILCNAPTSIVVHESVPARSLAELIAYAKASPGKLSYGSAGAGTLTNLAGELFKQLIGAPDIVHIPYKGSAPGVADLASGHIPMMTPNVGGPLLDFHRAGKVRIL